MTRNTVHFHGGHVPARADGFPEDLVSPPDGFPNKVVFDRGEHYDYFYPMLDPGLVADNDIGRDHADCGETPSTLWYHDHLLDFTAAQRLPRAGRFLSRLRRSEREFDPERAGQSALDIGDETFPDTDPFGHPTDPRILRLPSNDFDIPLVFQDKSFAADGSLVYNSFDHDGFLGDKICVNGAIQPFLRVQRRKYRFRLLNGSNARIYQIFLADASGGKKPMTQIATEGGLMAAPIRNISSVLLYMAERVEVVIDFTNYAHGTELFLENRLRQDEGRKPDGVMSRGPQMLKFIVEGDPVEDPSSVPDVLRPFPKVTENEIRTAVRRTFEFERRHGAWAINGELAGQLTRPVATARLDRGEIWRLRNDSGGWWHPVHIHHEFCRVLSRNGKLPPLDERDGMAKKDTLLLRDNETVEVYVKFRDYVGPVGVPLSQPRARGHGDDGEVRRRAMIGARIAVVVTLLALAADGPAGARPGDLSERPAAHAARDGGPLLRRSGQRQGGADQLLLHLVHDHLSQDDRQPEESPDSARRASGTRRGDDFDQRRPDASTRPPCSSSTRCGTARNRGGTS